MGAKIFCICKIKKLLLSPQHPKQTTSSPGRKQNKATEHPSKKTIPTASIKGIRKF